MAEKTGVEADVPVTLKRKTHDSLRIMLILPSSVLSSFTVAGSPENSILKSVAKAETSGYPLFVIV